jgi:hypothetical protein
MELVILSCLQAQLLVGKVSSHHSLSPIEKQELISEIKSVAPKECKFVDKSIK